MADPYVVEEGAVVDYDQFPTRVRSIKCYKLVGPLVRSWKCSSQATECLDCELSVTHCIIIFHVFGMS